MSWSRYGEFLAFVVVLVLLPGPDFAVVAKNTLAGGRHRGRWASAGVTLANMIQGTAAALGLSELVVRAQPVFQTIRWAGVVYLAVLPQFLVYGSGLGWSLLLAWSTPMLGLVYLLALVQGMHHARAALRRRRVRRTLDGATGAALLGFAAALAADSA